MVVGAWGRSARSSGGDAVQVVPLEERQPTADRFLPGGEIGLVMLAVTLFDRVLEFVERCGFRIEKFSIAVQKPVVDDTVQTVPLPLVGGPEWSTRFDDATREYAQGSRSFGSAAPAGLDAFSHGKSPFVECLAGDRARQMAPAALELGQITKVIERPDAAAGDERCAGHREDRPELVEVRAGQGPVTADLGDDECRDARLRKPLREVQKVPTTPGHPTSYRNLASVGVEADTHTAGVELTQHVDQLRGLDRRGPDDHALDTSAEELASRFDGANPSAGLDSARDGRADSLDGFEVAGRSGPGRVEVDDVNPARALRFELARDRDRVRVIDRLRVEVTTKQPHRVAAAQIDGRVEVYSAPFVLGSSLLSTRTASRRQRATPLNAASIT